MNSGNSGLAHGTSGSPQLTAENMEAEIKAAENEAAIEQLSNTFSFEPNSTAVVWNHINPTSENYGGTVIPKSFTIDTPSGKMWTHGNATEHMYDALNAIKKQAPLIVNSNPNLYSQFILYDYWKTLGAAVGRSIKYEQIVTERRWEFIFSAPRSGAKYPVVKHAKFLGL